MRALFTTASAQIVRTLAGPSTGHPPSCGRTGTLSRYTVYVTQWLRWLKMLWKVLSHHFPARVPPPGKPAGGRLQPDHAAELHASLPHASQPGRAGPRRFSSIFGSVG